MKDFISWKNSLFPDLAASIVVSFFPAHFLPPYFIHAKAHTFLLPSAIVTWLQF